MVLLVFVLIFLNRSKVFQISVANSFSCAGLALGTVIPNRNTELFQQESEALFVVVK